MDRYKERDIETNRQIHGELPSQIDRYREGYSQQIRQRETDRETEQNRQTQGERYLAEQSDMGTGFQNLGPTEQPERETLKLSNNNASFHISTRSSVYTETLGPTSWFWLVVLA